MHCGVSLTLLTDVFCIMIIFCQKNLNKTHNAKLLPRGVLGGSTDYIEYTHNSSLVNIVKGNKTWLQLDFLFCFRHNNFSIT